LYAGFICKTDLNTDKTDSICTAGSINEKISVNLLKPIGYVMHH